MTIGFSNVFTRMRDAITPPPTRSWVAPLSTEDLGLLLAEMTIEHNQHTSGDVRDALGEKQCQVIQQMLVGMVVEGFARADYFDGEGVKFQLLKDPTGFASTPTARRLEEKTGMEIR